MKVENNEVNRTKLAEKIVDKISAGSLIDSAIDRLVADFEHNDETFQNEWQEYMENE